jgi:hypothetical protein
MLFAEPLVCIQWNSKGYPSLITDPAPILALGGLSKIDSIQNVILLRSDLHDSWDNYEFAVNPDVRCSFHSIIWFTASNLIYM